MYDSNDRRYKTIIMLKRTKLFPDIYPQPKISHRNVFSNRLPEERKRLIILSEQANQPFPTLSDGTAKANLNEVISICEPKPHSVTLDHARGTAYSPSRTFYDGFDSSPLTALQLTPSHSLGEPPPSERSTQYPFNASDTHVGQPLT